MVELISKDEFTGEKLLEIYKQAYYDANLGSDGSIVLVIDGLRVIAKVESAPRFLMTLACGITVKPQATRQQVLEFCNRINDKLIMVRACYPEAASTPVLWLDHCIDTEAGVTAEEMIDETRRFVKIIPSIPPHDTEGLLG